MRTIWTLTAKDLALLARDRGGLFFTLAFPLLFAVVFGAIFESLTGASRGRIPIALVDEDNSAESRAFLARLSQSRELRPDILAREQAVNWVRQGKRPACLILPPGFGESMAARPAGPPPVFQIGIDPSRRPEAMLVQGALTRQMLEDLKRGLPGADALQPLRFDAIDVGITRTAPKNYYAVSFPQGMLWGVIGATAAAGVSIVLERRRGTLRRARIAPISLWHILAGKALTCLLLIVLVLTALSIFGWLVFDVRPRDPLLLAVAIVSTGIAFVGVMVLLSLLGRSEMSAIAVCWGTLTLLSMIGGGMVPFMAMPPWLRTIGVISPVYWSISALEGALWREYTLAELLTPCKVLWGIGIACFAIGVLGFRRLERT